MIRQVTMDVAIVDPTEAALVRHDLVVDPPAGDQVRDDQAMEGHPATTPQVVQLAGSQHPAPTDLDVTMMTAETARLDPSAATDQGAQSAAIARLVRSATTAPVVRNAEDVPIAAQVAAMGHPRNACGPRAERPRVETTTPANVSLKKIVTRSASVRSVHFTRHPRSLKASPRRCLTALLPMN
ncbi:MAG: hypothetical protein ACKVI4_12755 [Actinomycetales bacterium]